MRSTWTGLLVATAAALSGCYTTGVHLVRGTVQARGAGGLEPVSGASVQCRESRDGPPRYARVTTKEDGAYRIEYPYAGRSFPMLMSAGGDPYLEVSAPGYETRLVRLLGGNEKGVTRGESGPYARIDVTLVPAAAPPPPAGK
jgi:hypothetical protein